MATVPEPRKEKKCPLPWTKQIVCLAYCDQSRVPTFDEELNELYHAGLRMKKITISDINNVTNNAFKKFYPALERAGGFEYLRCVPNIKQLELYSELAQSNPKILQERSNKGKVYIRLVQRDLIQSARKTAHVCLNDGLLI